MESLRLFSLPTSRLFPYPSLSSFPFQPSSTSFQPPPSPIPRQFTRLHVSTSPSSTTTTSPNPTPTSETFDWFSHWYPLGPICDLDKRAPKAKTVLGLDVVVWWDRVEGAWKVFDDKCPHRLAPLSEGRVDPQGRLQCVYHGWCFDGAGACKYIPQAPSLGPPVHKNEKACVAVYPCVEQNKILWFWPNTDPRYKDILNEKKPPYIPELDDPSFTATMGTRDLLYGYEVLTENLMDPSHVPYAHHGLMNVKKRVDPGRVETDREGGAPIEITIEKLDINGFLAKQETGYFKFVPPCLFYGSASKKLSVTSPSSKEEALTKTTDKEPRFMLIFMCVPVSPGKSRVVYAFPRNFAVWLDKIIPRWYYHIGQNLILDSDLYLLHLEERKLASAGNSNWHKACYVPTKSDAMVIAFRSWFRKYSNNQLNWGSLNQAPQLLPSTPPREQLLDRYWSHVVQCTSCSGALKTLKAIEVSLQVVSVAIIGFFAVAKQSLVSNIAKTTVISVAVLCFAASRWLSHFIHKTFYFHDYNHAFK
ncbi:protochlorophyllide-dependent translocon component 52, chloroplastic-like [Carex rostrata]